MRDDRPSPALAYRIATIGVTFAIAITATVVDTRARVWRVTPEHGGDAPSIAAAVDSAAPGDVVLLAPGTYSWSSEAAQLPSMIRLRPGLTLRGEGGATATFVDGEYRGRILEGVNVANVVVEGLTFRNGLAPPEQVRFAVQATGPSDSHGGAMEFRGASTPLIRHCVFTDNHANGGRSTGGAVSCDTAVFEDCEFSGNRAAVAGAPEGHGGAIFCADARIDRCTFRNNHAFGYEAAAGGAVACGSSTIRDCVFTDNLADCPGGPLGGAISSKGTIAIERCVFRGNRTEAHYFHANGGAIELLFGSISDCLFIDNTAHCWRGPGRGGGVFGADFDIDRCTFIANGAMRTDPPGPGQGGAIYARFDVDAEHCTLVANSGGTADGVGGIWVEETASLRHLIVTRTIGGRLCNGNANWICCDLFANTAGDAICGTDGGGNYSSDPLFCTDPVTSGDVSLQAGSPCLARGNCATSGAGSEACAATVVLPRTWSAVKHLFR